MYDSFGNLASQVGTFNHESPYCYTGRELDEDTGLYYYGARYYDADTGRFLSYDPVGNRLLETGQTVNSTFDDANRLLDDTNFTYTYDLNGNMTSKTDKITFEITNYTYDAENQLIQVDKPGVTATFRYDSFGRRIEKNINGTSERYVYNGEHILELYDSNNAYLGRFAYGPGVDEILFYGRSARHYYLTDGLGSVTDVTIWNGTAVKSYVYDSFGRIASESGALTNNHYNPYTYTGRELDEETGLYYYRARYYDADTGRFLQEDPIGFIAGVNLYPYVSNRPLDFVDPYGLIKWGDVFPPAGGYCAGKKLATNFIKLQKANNTNPNAPFYYHCLAYCEIAQDCGVFGAIAGFSGEGVKEGIDCALDKFTCSLDNVDDLDANDTGFKFGKSGVCCEESCRGNFPF